MPSPHEAATEAVRFPIDSTPAIAPARIAALPHPYRLVRDIPVEVEMVSSAEAIACFRDADMAMSGDDAQDAVDGLQAFILDCLDDWRNAPPDRLGPVPTRQFEVLRRYVEWA